MGALLAVADRVTSLCTRSSMLSGWGCAGEAW